MWTIPRAVKSYRRLPVHPLLDMVLMGLANEQGISVEEGGDMEFAPDQVIRHGDIIEGGNWSVECVYTPGHTSNHMCFA